MYYCVITVVRPFLTNVDIAKLYCAFDRYQEYRYSGGTIIEAFPPLPNMDLAEHPTHNE